MRKLDVSPDLKLPPDAVTRTFGLLGMRGGGKTNAARVLAEQMYESKLPFVAVDPVGSWWGLRSDRAGTGPGLSLPIFGGRHGDVPLEPTGGELLADLVVEQRFSCVIDCSELSETAKRQFLLAFAERLYRRNTEALHLFLEEADDYLPQKPMREQAHLLRAFENIVRRGRARGLGITLITQRSAVLNKNVLTQCDTLVALRVTSPQDRRAIEAWVEFHGQSEEVLTTLPELQNGEAWVWSPEWLGLREPQRIRFHLSRTFDSGATPKAASGKARPPATMADVDLDAIRSKMASTIERAKADDPKALRAKVAALQRELKQAQATTAAAPRAKEKRIEAPVLKEAQVRRLEATAARLADVGEKAIKLAGEVVAAVRAGAAAATRPATTPPPAPRPLPERRAVARRRSVATGEPLDDDALTGPEQRILDAIAWMESLGINEPEQTAVAFLAGYTIGGGAFNNPRGRLNVKALVEYRPGERIALTDAGRERANFPAQALSNDELQRRVLERLPGPEKKLLAALLEVYPDSLSNEELAERTGYSAGGGAFNNPRGRLRTLGLIDYINGRVVARPLLFPEG